MANELQIDRLIVGAIETNCYIARTEGSGEAFVVDPGDEGALIVSFLKDKGCVPAAVLLTHGHYDHTQGLKEILEKWPSCRVYASSMERPMLEDDGFNCTYYGFAEEPFRVSPDVYVEAEQEFSLLGRAIKTLWTPGHTKGSVCYYLGEDGVLFSGDTLFNWGVGRTDLPTGNTGEMMQSLTRLFKELPADTKVYPGHGEFTTIGEERSHGGFRP